MDTASSSSYESSGPQHAPPTYTASTERHSIMDLRAQIRANCAILNPKYDPHRDGGAHMETIVGQVTIDDQQLTNGKGKLEDNKQSAIASAGPPKVQHYAVVVRRSLKKADLKIILKGEPKDSVIEALEWMLCETEKKIHETVQRCGREYTDDCCVM